MILSILLILFFILLFFISIGFLIAGIARKQKNMWLSALIGAVLSILIPSYIILKGVSDTLNYVASEDFQEDTKKGATVVGSAAGNAASGAAVGLGNALDEKDFAVLAKKSATIVGEGIKATAAGLDGSLGKTTIFTTKQVDDLGIKLGRADQGVQGSSNSVGIYTEFTQPFKGMLKLESYDSQGQKMDFTVIEVDEKAGAEKNLIFTFKEAAPGITGYCILYGYLGN